MSLGTLVILPSLAAALTGQGEMVVTRKFLDGMRGYAERWPGPVATLLDTTYKPTNNLDNVKIRPNLHDLPFGIDTVKFGSRDLYRRLDDLGATCVLGGPHHRLHGLPKELRSRGIVSVMCSEYSLRTRIDIMRHETRNPLRMVKQAAWETREELLTLMDVAAAHGIQCNGTPTYERYRQVNPNAHLYFDTRTSDDGFATLSDMDQRSARLRDRKRPLHIAFSGRLLRMKGAHHLVKIADGLLDRGVNFRMTICGGGELESSIKREIGLRGLLGRVSMAGVLDFERQLLPMMREQVDLFIAPHVQGDPSCTYLETLACGVPIVGYANEAWSGVLDRATVGWDTPVGKPEKMAELIASLDRRDIESYGKTALRFARDHSFNRTFARRVDHMVDLLREHRSFRRAA